MSALLPWAQYNALDAACKFRLTGLAAIVLMAVVFGPGLAASELEIVSGPGHAGDLEWRQFEFRYSPAVVSGQGQWRISADGLTMAAFGDLGRVVIECHHGALGTYGPTCDRGSLDWVGGPMGLSWETAFSMEAGPQRATVLFSDDVLTGSVHWPRGQQPITARIEIGGGDLSHLPQELLEAARLRELQGEVSGQATFDNGEVRIGLEVQKLEFDSDDGLMAGAGIDATLAATLRPEEGAVAFSLELNYRDGELLIGSLYLPPPDGELVIGTSGKFDPAGRIDVHDFSLVDPGAVQLEGAFSLASGDDGWQVDLVQLDWLDFELPGGWTRWADGLLASHGLGGLETQGTVSASLLWRNARIERLAAKVESVIVEDPAGRFRIDQFDADVILQDGALEADLAWEVIKLYGLPLGRASATIVGDETQIRLAGPLRMPLLDGAVVIERLVWEFEEADDRELALDASIEPVDLAALTRLLEFPEFGGTLSGRFPGVVYADERLAFTGGIDISAFSGRINLSELAVERPFGTLPALAAQVEFQRLDLAEVTGAFNFGHMEGQLSGWIRDLRLLDWRPVAMGARVFTHEDAPRRRISQRAVENLSSLGGAPGGALVSGTVMRVFSEFPYRQAGLACRLSNNICYIDGVAPHESGGFYIVQGRALPRLDIIGHRRLVDWPQLMSQLEAMLEGEQDGGQGLRFD